MRLLSSRSNRFALLWPLLGKHLDTRAPHSDEGKLRRYKEAVGKNEKEDQRNIKNRDHLTISLFDLREESECGGDLSNRNSKGVTGFSDAWASGSPAYTGFGLQLTATFSSSVGTRSAE